MNDNGNLSDRKFRAKAHSEYLRIPQVPIEWYGSSSWRLPSGKALAEFALQAGFLAPLLLKTEGMANPGLPSLGCKSSRAERSLKKAGQA